MIDVIFCSFVRDHGITRTRPFEVSEINGLCGTNHPWCISVSDTPLALSFTCPCSAITPGFFFCFSVFGFSTLLLISILNSIVFFFFLCLLIPPQPFYTSRTGLAPSTGSRGIPPSSAPRAVTPTHVYQAGPGSQMMMIPQQQLSFPSSPQGPAYFIPGQVSNASKMRSAFSDLQNRILMTLLLSSFLPFCVLFFLVPVSRLYDDTPAVPSPSRNSRLLPWNQPRWIWYFW